MNDLFVRADARKHGVGRALLREALQLAQTTGAKGLTLSTSAHNKAAQQLYESEGYVQDTAFWHYDLIISK